MSAPNPPDGQQRPDTDGQGDRTQQNGWAPHAGRPPYDAQPGHGQPYPGPPSGQQQFGQQQFGAQQFGAQQFGAQQFGPPYGGQQPSGQAPHNQNPYGQPPPYGQNQYNQNQHGHNQYGHNQYGQPPHGRPQPGPTGGGANVLIPAGFGGVPLPPDIPQTVQRAFLIWLVIIGVNVVGTIVSTVGYADVFSGVGIVFALLGAAVGVFLALHFRGRQQWARIVLTVLTGLAMLSSLFALVGSLVLLALAPVYGILSLAASAVVLAGGALALVNAWNASSNAWFGKLPVLR